MKDHQGCLILLIPLTAITGGWLAYSLVQYAYFAFVRGDGLFPPTVNFGLIFIFVTLVCNIPTALIWWAFFVMKRANDRHDRSRT